MTRIRTLASLLLLLGFALPVLAQDGDKAPDFTLEDINDEEIRLTEVLENGPVLLDFWATWCRPCKQALPLFAAIYDDLKDQGFTLLAISVDDTKSMNKVKPYVKSNEWEFPVLYDPTSEVLKSFRGRTVPHAVLISQDGRIVKTWIGYHSGEEEEVRAEIMKLLGANE